MQLIKPCPFLLLLNLCIEYYYYYYYVYEIVWRKTWSSKSKSFPAELNLSFNPVLQKTESKTGVGAQAKELLTKSLDSIKLS